MRWWMDGGNETMWQVAPRGQYYHEYIKILGKYNKVNKKHDNLKKYHAWMETIICYTKTGFSEKWSTQNQ